MSGSFERFNVVLLAIFDKKFARIMVTIKQMIPPDKAGKYPTKLAQER